MPYTIARGDLLYRDVVYWFGPFTPYFHAPFSALFGSSFSTLVAAGVVGSIATSRRSTSLSGRSLAPRGVSLVRARDPALVFMPNSGGSILGMGYRIWHAAAFALAAIALASRPAPARRPFFVRPRSAFSAGLAGLCRTEWGRSPASGRRCVRVAERPVRERLKGAVVSGGDIILIVSSVLRSGRSSPLRAGRPSSQDGHVLLTGLPAETRTFLVEFSGVRDWRGGVLELLYSAATLDGRAACPSDPRDRRDRSAAVRGKLPILAVVLLVVVLCARLGGAGGKVLFSAAPLVCLGRRRSRSFPGPPEPRSPRIRDRGYASSPIVAPFTSATPHTSAHLSFCFRLRGRAPSARHRRRKGRSVAGEVRLSAAVVCFALVVLAFAGRAVRYARDDGYAVPGTREMLSASRSAWRGWRRLPGRCAGTTRSGRRSPSFPRGRS